jgi:hypothetical protein
MNKQLTKKTIGIAASAALMAAALSATAVADNPNKGPKASIKVAAWCDYDVDAYRNLWLNVHTLVTDSGGPVSAELKSPDVNDPMPQSIQPMQGRGNNKGGEKFTDIGDPIPGVPSMIGEIQGDQPVDFETTRINLCEAGLNPDANAANALVTVRIVGGHKDFTAMCGDHDFNGDGYLDRTSDVKIGHLDKCN